MYFLHRPLFSLLVFAITLPDTLYSELVAFSQIFISCIYFFAYGILLARNFLCHPDSLLPTKKHNTSVLVSAWLSLTPQEDGGMTIAPITHPDPLALIIEIVDFHYSSFSQAPQSIYLFNTLPYTIQNPLLKLNKCL